MSKALYKRNEKKVVNNHIGPNRSLYGVLLALAIIITITCFAIPQDNPWFTIGAGIGCGGVASTIVAWLIDEANTKKELRRISNNREILFERIKSAFANGLQILIFNTKQYLHDNFSRNWFEWVEDAYLITKSNNDFCKDFNISIMLFFNDITEQIYGIEAQSAVMLEQNIIEKEDLEALSLIMSLCDLSKQEFHASSDEVQISRHFKTNCQLIKIALEYSVNMCTINKILIVPVLYNMSLDIDDPTHVDNT